jgi:hypothetical protein
VLRAENPRRGNSGLIPKNPKNPKKISGQGSRIFRKSL